jgi:hypothetical protein
LLAAALVVVSASCVVRLATVRRLGPVPAEHEDLAQVAMAIGMIVLFLPGPGGTTDLVTRTVLLLVFGVEAVGWTGLLLRGTRSGTRETWECVHHLMASLAMVYLALAVVGDTGAMSAPMSEMAPMAPLGTAFGMYFLLYAVWAGARMLRPVPVVAGGGTHAVGAVGVGRAVVAFVAGLGGGGRHRSQVAPNNRLAEIPVLLRRPRVVEGCRAIMGAGMACMLLAGM